MNVRSLIFTCFFFFFFLFLLLPVKEYTDKVTGSAKKTVAVRVSNTNQFKILKYPYNADGPASNGGKGGGNNVFEGKDNGQVYD